MAIYVFTSSVQDRLADARNQLDSIDCDVPPAQAKKVRAAIALVNEVENELADGPRAEAGAA